jgi:hypothetical protein
LRKQLARCYFYILPLLLAKTAGQSPNAAAQIIYKTAPPAGLFITNEF